MASLCDIHESAGNGQFARPTMKQIIHRTLTHPLLAIGSTLLWGVVELLALNRRRRERG